MTANQVVAFNLRRARHLRGWSQREAIEQLAPHLAKPWSTVVLSGAECSVKGRRIKKFDADDLAAFAAAFDVPVAFFFEHPARYVATTTTTVTYDPETATVTYEQRVPVGSER